MHQPVVGFVVVDGDNLLHPILFRFDTLDDIGLVIGGRGNEHIGIFQPFFFKKPMVIVGGVDHRNFALKVFGSTVAQLSVFFDHFDLKSAFKQCFGNLLCKQIRPEDRYFFNGRGQFLIQCLGYCLDLLLIPKKIEQITLSYSLIICRKQKTFLPFQADEHHRFTHEINHMNIRFTCHPHRDKTVLCLRKTLDIVGFGECKQCPDLFGGQPVGENRKINPQLLNDPTVGKIVISQSYDLFFDTDSIFDDKCTKQIGFIRVRYGDEKINRLKGQPLIGLRIFHIPLKNHDVNIFFKFMQFLQIFVNHNDIVFERKLLRKRITDRTRSGDHNVHAAISFVPSEILYPLFVQKCGKQYVNDTLWRDLFCIQRFHKKQFILRIYQKKSGKTCRIEQLDRIV